ncbi:TBC1 domain member 20 [Mycena indigotica]|uniref:TBC1 domain member 20 n=1 Tax=Mycena indigotica TaxID=2126181 RepID=A0A8H6W9I1_9AGAR|nr:TBC1 domain member 20 [Mycena indigotica]KAF7309722.1 TBC1 domain member 20 [Mycena indigotica]
MNSENTPLDQWDDYRLLSLEEDGFRQRRVEIWSRLLHVSEGQPMDPTASDLPSHPDERQIRLDTERSFVLYPVDTKADKDELQNELHELLVQLFRKRPGLSYFQGYHDIITVLLLTLPSELQLSCAEQLSLQRVRDSMGSTLEPVLGLLRVTRNLIRLVDPEYAALLEQTAPLPYYALSNLLTMFAHDMPTLPLIQHTFDYLLCRPPIMVVYLATAVILSRKADVQRLEEEGEEGMLHSLMSALPTLVDHDTDIVEEFLSLNDNSEKLPEINEDEIPSMDQSENMNEPLGQLAAPSIDESPAPIVVGESSSEPIEDECDPPLPTRPKPKPQVLTALLAASDQLYNRYPPTHPSIRLSSIMGPQSVVFTWSARAKDMPSSDEAERMVQRLDLIVYPEPLPVPEQKNTPRRPHKRMSNNTGLIVGATLVLGVAIAVSVYGNRHNGDPVRELRKTGQWLGGLLTGVAERIAR